MKKILFYFCSCACAILPLSAMNHFAGQHDVPESEKSLKWSTCIWTNNVSFKVDPLPSKPGSTDYAAVRHGRYSLMVDQNINVGYLVVGDDSELHSAKRTLKVNRSLRLTVPPANCTTLMDLSDCTVDVGGAFEYAIWHKHMSAGRSELRLENTKMNVKSDLTVILAANPQLQNSEPACLMINMIGKSELNFNGGAMIDSIIKDDPAQWSFRLRFEPKGGNVPSIKFNRKGVLESFDVEVVLKDDIKPGIYPLIECNAKKSGLENIRSFKVNDNTYNLGDPLTIGKKTMKIYMGGSPRSRDTRTPNDLLLEVK